MFKTKLAINGFGRIGRCILRAYSQLNLSGKKNKKIQINTINAGSGNIDDMLHLLKYDSVHGILPKVTKIDNEHFDIGTGPIKIIFERNIENLNWKDLDANVILECTGAFADKKLAMKHINNGAKKVVVSAPCQEADVTIIFGVNESLLDDSHQIISIGSCTTNCLAPIAKILNNTIGIEHGFVTTVHAYTNDQNLVDSKHKDRRRSRAASLSMIPTSTGAARSIASVLPELAGRLDGAAIRVPISNVSLIDFKFTAKQKTTAEQINKIMRHAITTIPKNIISVTEEELVSVDFNHTIFSAIFDCTQTKVIDGRFCRVLAWYDNEWAFANRMLDVSAILLA